MRIKVKKINTHSFLCTIIFILFKLYELALACHLLCSLKDGRHVIEIKLRIAVGTSYVHIVIANVTKNTK
jgi:hypothetical protein